MVNRRASEGDRIGESSNFRYAIDSNGSAVTVAALVRSVKDLLETRYRLTWVSGEISNVTLARSGHWYFVLKDAEAQVRCVMFRHRNQYLDWSPREGMRVDVRATVTLYEARGEFQLNVETMRQAGRGALFEAFLRLRDKLQSEGLFSADLKRPLPEHPRRIGLVTSLHAAAMRDVLSTLRRRNPTIPVVIYPAGVQGGNAAGELIAALESAGRRNECDVLIVARGGGSIEDLWCFNDEQLARTLRASPIPIVTGIGHETDFTIADFVADVRAPTPTAAAELVAPPLADVMERIASLAWRLTERVRREIESRMQALDYLQRRLIDPRRLVGLQRAALTALARRLTRAAAASLRQDSFAFIRVTQRLAARLPQTRAMRTDLRLHASILASAARSLVERQRSFATKHTDALRHLDPLAVLGRGYSITRDQAGNVVTNAASVEIGQALTITLARGGLAVKVDDNKA